MVQRSEALQALRAHTHELQQLGVETIAIFGSVARGDAVAGSDIDVLVEVRRPMGLFGLAKIQRYLEGIFETRVDLVTIGALKDSMRDDVLREAVRAA